MDGLQSVFDKFNDQEPVANSVDLVPQGSVGIPMTTKFSNNFAFWRTKICPALACRPRPKRLKSTELNSRPRASCTSVDASHLNLACTINHVGCKHFQHVLLSL